MTLCVDPFCRKAPIKILKDKCGVPASCIFSRAVKVSALIYAINVAAINAIKYFNAVNATLFTSGVC